MTACAYWRGRTGGERAAGQRIRLNLSRHSCEMRPLKALGLLSYSTVSQSKAGIISDFCHRSGQSKQSMLTREKIIPILFHVHFHLLIKQSLPLRVAQRQEATQLSLLQRRNHHHWLNVCVTMWWWMDGYVVVLVYIETSCIFVLKLVFELQMWHTKHACICTAVCWCDFQAWVTDTLVIILNLLYCDRVLPWYHVVSWCPQVRWLTETKVWLVSCLNDDKWCI